MFFYRQIMQNIIKNWKEKQVLSGTLATDSNDNFGYSVAMNSVGDRVVVGAFNDEIGPANVTQGLAYVFVSGAGGWIQQPVLTGSLAISGDNFGSAVSMNSVGDRVIVGARADERSGGQISEGLAYVFVSGTGGWTEQPILSGTLAINSTDQFGLSVAMNSAGDRVIVGAQMDERSGGALSEGLAYVFVSGAGGWSQQPILSGNLATSSNDQFGISVAMNSAGDRVVVGAFNDERSGQASNYNEGLAYVFVSGTGGWSQQQVLSGTFANNTDDWFGYSVAMNSAGDRIIVGAYNDERISGPGTSGLAYLFVSGTNGWTQQHILSGTLAAVNDNFGNAVAMNSAGDRVIVGAINDERSAGALSEGLAYIFNEE